MKILNFDSTIATVSAGTAAAPSISFANDPNTGIYSPGADQVAISTGGTGRLLVDASGRVGIGTSTARANFYNSTASAQMQLEGVGFANAAISSIATGNFSYDSGSLILGKGRGAAIGANTVVQNNDILGYISFQGNDATEFVEGGSIKIEVDGTPGANDMPGRLVFSTTSDGSASPQERLRITSTGQLRLAGAGITFNGDTATANELDDYEEGTFTPTITAGITTPTYSANTRGTYRKIGSFVYFTLRVQLTAGTTSAAGLVVGGLPFAISANIEFRVIFHGSFLSGAGTASVTAAGLNSVTYMDILNAGSGAVISGTTATNTMDIQITGAYPTTV